MPQTHKLYCLLFAQHHKKLDEDFSDFIPGEIPDAAFIHAARKRRQLARELGGDAPLVETEAPKKRLVREDQDASDDEDEEEKRIRFSGVRNKSQRQKIAEEIGTLFNFPACCLLTTILNQIWVFFLTLLKMDVSFICVQVLRVVMMKHWIPDRMRRWAAGSRSKLGKESAYPR